MCTAAGFAHPQHVFCSQIHMHAHRVHVCREKAPKKLKLPSSGLLRHALKGFRAALCCVVLQTEAATVLCEVCVGLTLLSATASSMTLQSYAQNSKSNSLDTTNEQSNVEWGEGGGRLRADVHSLHICQCSTSANQCLVGKHTL